MIYLIHEIFKHQNWFLIYLIYVSCGGEYMCVLQCSKND